MNGMEGKFQRENSKQQEVIRCWHCHKFYKMSQMKLSSEEGTNE